MHLSFSHRLIISSPPRSMLLIISKVFRITEGWPTFHYSDGGSALGVGVVGLDPGAVWHLGWHICIKWKNMWVRIKMYKKWAKFRIKWGVEGGKAFEARDLIRSEKMTFGSDYQFAISTILTINFMIKSSNMILGILYISKCSRTNKLIEVRKSE